MVNVYSYYWRIYIWKKKKKTTALIQKDTCIPMFTATLFIIASMEAAYIFINKWMNKEDLVYVCNGKLVDHKNKILPFAATWMDLEGIILTEISHKEKDNYCMISLIYGI